MFSPALTPEEICPIIPAEQVFSPEQRIDTVIPFTYSCNIDADTARYRPARSVYLSALSEMAIVAACDVAQANDAELLIAGEHSYGRALPSTADLMEEHAERAGIAPDRIVKLEGQGQANLRNTPQQIKALAKHFKNNTRPSDKALVVGMGYHLQRIHLHAMSRHFNPQYAGVEDILRYEEKDGQYPVEFIDHFAISEDPVQYEAYWDRRGWVPNILTYLLGQRLHDIPIVDGQYTPVSISTRRRLKEVKMEVASSKPTTG